MEMVFAVAGIDLKLVFLVVDLESAIGDAVGETARRLARTRAIVEIIPRVWIAEDDVFHVAVAVGRDNAHDARTDIAQLHLHAVGIGQGIELDVFAVGGLAPNLYFYVHIVSNSECGMRNAECRNATLGFALIQHSAFIIPNSINYSDKRLSQSARGSCASRRACLPCR